MNEKNMLLQEFHRLSNVLGQICSQYRKTKRNRLPSKERNKMAIYIKITRVLENGNIGFYHIFTKHGGDTQFYVGFDRKLHKIYCLLTDNFSHSVGTI